MRVTLVHNPTAGSGSISAEEIMELLRVRSHDVACVSTGADDLARAFDNDPEVILVAGGDGTIAKVACMMTGRSMPLSIIPSGTSNNIARQLCVRGSPEEIVDRMPKAEKRALDVGTASGPWGCVRFVESAGVGVFSAMLEHGENAPGLPVSSAVKDSRLEGVRSLKHALSKACARHYRVEVDGKDCSGDYLLVIAMNIASVGPRLSLAPDADASDRQFDLVLLGEDKRLALNAYLDGLLKGGPDRIHVRAMQAGRVLLEWDPAEGHVDDRPWPRHQKTKGLVELSFADAPVEVLV